MKHTDYLLDELEEMFDRVDENGDRSISFDEFKALMREMSDPRPESALLAGFSAIDLNRDGRINFDEFRAWLVPAERNEM